VTLISNSTIKVRTSFRGFHYWSSAPEEVSFLRNKHRHIFYVEVTIPVNHDDRDLEFFLVQQQIDSVISLLFKDTIDVNLQTYDLQSQSCEMIASKIGKILLNRYLQIDQITVSVSEDEENFGIVTIQRVQSDSEISKPSGLIELKREEVR
jgi:6-pyruvoyl-tetrahydropterin synthase